MPLFDEHGNMIKGSYGVSGAPARPSRTNDDPLNRPHQHRPKPAKPASPPPATRSMEEESIEISYDLEEVAPTPSPRSAPAPAAQQPARPSAIPTPVVPPAAVPQAQPRAVAASPAPAANVAPMPMAPPAPARVEVAPSSSKSAAQNDDELFSGPGLPVPQLEELMHKMLAMGEGVSDLFIVAGRPPQVTLFGNLTHVKGTRFEPFMPTDTEQIACTLVDENPRLMNDLVQTGSCDTSYSIPGVARFRINIYKQQENFAAVMRKLSTKIPSMADLKLAPIFQKIVSEQTGLVFVTGATGSGKTTTLAALLNELNETKPIHVVTLEDPIEFTHPHKVATFSQRELGRDFSTFAAGLRAAVRQAPKAIFVGEIRDRETMDIALTAAETGHVVFSTLHTISATQAIGRILGMFSKEEEEQVRDRLAETLRWVVAQRLAPKVGGGRVMVCEIMGSNMRSREAIQMGENEVRNLYEIIEAANVEGWCTFEQSLVASFTAGEITEESAMLLSVNKRRMRKILDHALKTQGKDTTHTGGLRLKTETPKK